MLIIILKRVQPAARRRTTKKVCVSAAAWYNRRQQDGGYFAHDAMRRDYYVMVGATRLLSAARTRLVRVVNNARGRRRTVVLYRTAVRENERETTDAMAWASEGR